MKTSVVTLDPKRAYKLLDNMVHNRPVYDGHVDYLATQIKSGNWVLNGQGIVVSDKGKLLDGQHRCWAVIQANQPIEIMMVEGVDEEYFDRIDVGKVRTWSDALVIDNAEQSLTKSVAGPIVTAIKIIRCCDDATGVIVKIGGRAKMSNHDMIEFVRSHPDIIDDAKNIIGMGKFPLPVSMVIAFYFLTKAGFPEKSIEFARRLQSGIGLGSGSPILLLRNWLTLSDSQGVHRQDVLIGFYIKAWNAFAQDMTMAQLRYSPSSEHMPSVILRPGQKLTKIRRQHSRDAAAKLGISLARNKSRKGGSVLRLMQK